MCLSRLSIAPGLLTWDQSGLPRRLDAFCSRWLWIGNGGKSPSNVVNHLEAIHDSFDHGSTTIDQFVLLQNTRKEVSYKVFMHCRSLTMASHPFFDSGKNRLM